MRRLQKKTSQKEEDKSNKSKDTKRGEVFSLTAEEGMPPFTRLVKRHGRHASTHFERFPLRGSLASHYVINPQTAWDYSHDDSRVVNGFLVKNGHCVTHALTKALLYISSSVSYNIPSYFEFRAEMERRMNSLATPLLCLPWNSFFLVIFLSCDCVDGNLYHTCINADNFYLLLLWHRKS